MTENQWKSFISFRQEFRAKCDEWSSIAHILTPFVVDAAKDDTPPYPQETAVVYNRALDDITEKSDIRYIIVGDNPGKDEQLAKNNRYLVGNSGKIAQGFFARNPELGADFRQNVIILNKTPIHTAKTNHLRKLARADSKVADLINESQKWMAERTAKLHIDLADDVELWLVGYTEMKKKGIFALYRDTLASSYAKSKVNFQSCDLQTWECVMVFQHFSMNRFSIDLNEYQKESRNENNASDVVAAATGAVSVKNSLSALGKRHRIEIFGK